MQEALFHRPLFLPHTCKHRTWALVEWPVSFWGTTHKGWKVLLQSFLFSRGPVCHSRCSSDEALCGPLEKPGFSHLTLFLQCPFLIVSVLVLTDHCSKTQHATFHERYRLIFLSSLVLLFPLSLTSSLPLSPSLLSSPHPFLSFPSLPHFLSLPLSPSFLFSPHPNAWESVLVPLASAKCQPPLGTSLLCTERKNKW